MPRRIGIARGGMALEVAPDLGGAIASLTFGEVDILRPLPAGEDVIVNQSACYPLVPYSNRIAGGRFAYEGERFQLARNFGDHPHSIHGNAWQRPWEVADTSDRSIALTFVHSPVKGEEHHWPWPYQATQLFELHDRELTVELTYRNLAGKAVPVGLGFHPYFPDASAALLHFSAGKVLFNGPDSLPVSMGEVPPEWSYRSPRAPVAGSIDNCFCDWEGPATITWPGRKVTVAIDSPQATNAVLFIPPAAKNFVAVEPVTNVNNAINDLPVDLDGRAMRRVAPGETLSLQMSIRVSSHE
ncbi:aldose 1-epimerase [Azospirillum thermophilum]|uniref:Aldose 1-epimerase n=1 Tax=Azospirillum thermophilum TaxID=2202148 RepID=A0A2S2CKI4_9PROT|nr:aldose 1-epimerase [Azospirillum thermophilum]AWK84939.1 aldose 1-epimerase [Azospirillum thermophilum]